MSSSIHIQDGIIQSRHDVDNGCSFEATGAIHRESKNKGGQSWSLQVLTPVLQLRAFPSNFGAPTRDTPVVPGARRYVRHDKDQKHELYELDVHRSSRLGLPLAHHSHQLHHADHFQHLRK